MDEIEINTKEKMFAHWVERYASRKGLDPYEVAELALFKLEGIKYTPSNDKELN